MSDKIVGTDVHIYEIINTIESASQPPSLASLMDKWSSVAMSLKTNRELVKKLRQRRLIEMDFETRELLFELLYEWQKRTGDKATIGALKRVWDENGMRMYSEALTIRFGSSYTPITVPPTLTTTSNFEKQRAHIERHLYELIGITNLHTIIIAQLQARDVLGDKDIALLESLNNKLEKNIEFYKLIRNKPGSYDVLIQAMESVSQTGVVNLLKKWNS